MATTSGISSLGQTIAQQNRLRNLQLQMADLQRQIATQKKEETYSGFGFDSLTLQRYRMDKGRTESYLSNITTVTTRINLMSDAMERASTIGRSLISSIINQPREGDIDMETISKMATDNISFLRDLLNTNLDGRYLFAGSDTGVMPFSGQTTMENNFEAEITDWLDGTITTTQLINNAEGFNTVQLGFDNGLGSSGNVSIRIEETTEIDYTVMGNANGFQDIMRALAFAANLTKPDPAGDVPTEEEFHEALDHIVTIAQRGVAALDGASTTLGSKFNLITSLKDSHEQDKALFENLISEIEDTDMTAAVAQLQAIQTNLTASYEVTRIVSQLSLVNFI